MSAPPTDVVDRLQRLAAGAPGGGIDPDALWTRGRRRQRVRTGGVAAALVLVGLAGATTTPLLVERVQQVEPARTDERMVLPDVIRQPGGWEPAFPSNPGRLSAVGSGIRDGLWSIRNAWWGVSASTGESRFLEPPGAADVFDTPALAADGWRLAYWVTGEVPGKPLTMSGSSEEVPAPAVGVAVLDLRTGSRDVWTVPSEHGLATNGLAWAGDELWWSAGPISPVGETGMRASDVVVRTWDVSTDERTEPSGESARVYTNSVGDGPEGFVESQGRRRVGVVAADAGARTLRLVLPVGSPGEAGTTEPTVSPDGARLATLLMPDASVFDGAPKPVLVGAVTDRAVELEALEGIEEQGIAGWRSPSELVVVSNAPVEDGRPPQPLRAWSLDVGSGERAPLLEFSGNAPEVAAEAWAAEVVPAPDAPFAPDPRLVGLGLLAGAFVAWRLVVRVRRRRGDA